MDELQNLLEEFEKKIKEEDKLNENKRTKDSMYSYYVPKIRDYFLPYIREDIEKRKCQERIKEYFETIFNREQIIFSSVYYVMNSPQKKTLKEGNRRSVTAIRDFLNSFSKFFELVLSDIYRMPSLNQCKPFQEKLGAEVKDRLDEKGILILNAETYPAMQTEEYEFIKNYFINYKKLTKIKLQVWIIFQLSFLYGLSMATLGDLRVTDINLERRTLRILSKDKSKNIILELPYELFVNIRKHINENDMNGERLLFFANKGLNDGTPIESSFYSYTLACIKEKYKKTVSDEALVLKRFNQYGMVKYAIIQMLNANIDISCITDITGCNVKFILSCREEKMGESKNLSEYVNTKMKNTKTYNDFNV